MPTISEQVQAGYFLSNLVEKRIRACLEETPGIARATFWDTFDEAVRKMKREYRSDNAV